MAYKILSLDGGGSWAMIQARILQDMFNDAKGQEILSHFDLAIANSGGSMVLAAMVSNLRMSEIVSIFATEAERRKVFSQLSFWENIGMKALRIFGVGAKYSAERKVNGLKEVLMERTKNNRPGTLLAEQPMSKLPTMIDGKFPDLVVCGYHFATERARFFRTNPNSKTDDFSDIKFDISLLDAIHASSNAPLNYFDAPAVIKTGVVGQPLNSPERYWDGAVGGFNNPVMAGLVEAMTNTEKNTASDYSILSIGTGTGRKKMLADFDKGTDDQRSVFNANQNNNVVRLEAPSDFKNDLGKMAQSILRPLRNGLIKRLL